jgi:HKD family nuclease
MKAQVIDNVSAKMSAALAQLIESSRDVRVAVAFASRQGISLIEPALGAALAAGGTAEFLIGLNMRSTEPEAVRSLLEMTRRGKGVELFCYAGLSDAGIYHPKLYLARSGEQVSFVVGSSNLTDGGLRKNVEVNVLVEASLRDEIVSDIYSTYNRLKFHPERVIPDDEFVVMYAELCRREKKASGDAAIAGLKREFKRKTATLRRPQPSRRDLFGWLELVYDALPAGPSVSSGGQRWQGGWFRWRTSSIRGSVLSLSRCSTSSTRLASRMTTRAYLSCEFACITRVTEMDARGN